MGGMAAYIPSRTDPEANALALEKVADDKVREVNAGFDGTWVAHPDLVPVALESFDRVLGARPNQIDRQRDDVEVGASELLDVRSTPGDVTEEGLRSNVSVGIQYLAAWLRGSGAVAINNLMEDAATAEISRSQIWQWVANGVTLTTGEIVTAAKAREAIQIEMTHLREQLGENPFAERRLEQARTLFEGVALPPDFVEFLTLPAYELL